LVIAMVATVGEVPSSMTIGVPGRPYWIAFDNRLETTWAIRSGSQVPRTGSIAPSSIRLFG